MNRQRTSRSGIGRGTIRRPSTIANARAGHSSDTVAAGGPASDVGCCDTQLAAVADRSQDTIARLEAALLLLATIMELDGDIHVPVFERLEAELASRRRVEDARERARRLLSAYSRSGDRSAICSKNLSLSSSEGPRPYLGL